MQMTAMISERRRCTSISDLSLVGVQRDEHEVDEFDEDERDDDPPHSADPDLPAQNGGGTGRAELYPSKGQGYQGNDDQGVEDDGREHGALWAVQLHDVECSELWIRRHEQGRDDGEVLRHVVGLSLIHISEPTR